MAAALPMVAQAANDDPTIKGIKQAAADEARAFAKDPIGETCDMLIKAGTIFAIAGGFLYAIAKATARQEQGYLNDIENRLGLPPAASPTPPPGSKPGAPPATLSTQAIDTAWSTMFNDLTQVDWGAVGGDSGQLTGPRGALVQVNKVIADLQDLSSQIQVNTQAENTSGVLSNIEQAIENFQQIVTLATEDVKAQSTANAGSINTVQLNTDALLGVVAAQLGIAVPASLQQPTVTQTINADPVIFTQALNDLSGWAQQIETDVSDVGTGLALIGRGLMNFPVLLWDGLGYGVTWGVNTVASDLWLLLLTLGLAMVLVGCLVKFFYKKFWPRLERRIELNANARVARLWARFDSWNSTRAKVGQVRKQAKVEESVVEANALAVPPEPVSVPATVEPAQTLHETPPLNASTSEPEPEKPLPMATPTTEIEQQLGEPKAIEPSADELRAQEAARVASLPPPPPPEPAQPQQAPPPINPPPRPRRKRRDSREPSSAQLMAMASA
jgi:hypothetical protein